MTHFTTVHTLMLLAFLLSTTTHVEGNSALLIVDVQSCFVEGGSLAVAGGGALPPIINSILDQHRHNFTAVVYTLDSHPPDHVSFASQHQGREELTEVKLYYDEQGHLCKPSTLKDPSRAQECSGDLKEVTQMLWPDHCIAHTHESNLMPSLTVLNASNVIFVRKGTERNIDSYSPFFNNGHFSHTELHATLAHLNVTKLFVVGIASDYCVKFASLDAKDLGYSVFVLKDAIAGVSTTSEQAAQLFQDNGINVIESREISREL